MSATAVEAGTPFRSAQMTASDFAKIRKILYDESGIAISEEKTSLVQSRLAKRLRELSLKKYTDYIDLLTGPSGLDERMNLISALTTNVTNFFREGHHFEHLRDHVFPVLREQMQNGGRARLWSAGCSTGQEAYSMAMTSLPLLEGIKTPDFRILATDIDPKVVAHGQAATYRESLVGDIPKDLRRKYMTPVAGGDEMQFVPAIRSLASFKRLNLLHPWPMRGTFDVIFCRNVVIYFDDPTRERLWKRFAQALRPGGVLYVGHSERLKSSLSTLFVNTGPTTYERTEAKVSVD